MKVLFIDTETTNNIDDPIFYDLGGGVYDTITQEFNQSFSFVNADVFCNKELMESAYFKDKIPQYWKEIKKGTRTLTSYYNIRKFINLLMKANNIKYVIAHNMRFDYRSTNVTQRYLTKSKFRFFFPYETQFLDTLKLSRKIYKEDINYIKFCKDNNFLCKNGTPRYTAEILYKFITNNLDFTEEHTGLQDVLIEKEIFTECINRGGTIEDALLW